MDDVMKEAEAAHAHNMATKTMEKKKPKKLSASKKRTLSPARKKNAMASEPTDNGPPRSTKKRRAGKDAYSIAKKMAESGTLFGGVAVPASPKKKSQATPPPSSPAVSSTKKTPSRKPSAELNPEEMTSRRHSASRIAPVAPAPRQELPRIIHEHVVSPRNEAMIQDITDDEVSEMPQELDSEEPIETSVDEEETKGTSLASKLSFSWIFILSFVIALGSVLLALPPVVSFIKTLNPKVVVHSASSFVSGRLFHLLQATVYNVSSLLMHCAGLWWASWTSRPLETISLSVFSYFLIATLYRYRQRKRRHEMTRERVAATRNKVYKDLYDSSQPVSPDNICARISFAEFPHSGSQRDAFKNDVWKQVIREIEGDPQVSVKHELRSGRIVTEWSWVDTNPPPAGI